MNVYAGRMVVVSIGGKMRYMIDRPKERNIGAYNWSLLPNDNLELRMRFARYSEEQIVRLAMELAQDPEVGCVAIYKNENDWWGEVSRLPYV